MENRYPVLRCRLLRPRRERPRRGAAKKSDELASLHVSPEGPRLRNTKS